MDLKKLIEQIDEDYYKINSYYLSLTDPEEFAKQVALKFGKQCFDAGREASYVATEFYIEELLENDKLQFKTFEDYLKNL